MMPGRFEFGEGLSEFVNMYEKGIFVYSCDESFH